MQYCLEIITCNHLLCIMDHPYVNVCSFMENPICLKRISKIIDSHVNGKTEKICCIILKPSLYNIVVIYNFDFNTF